MFTQYCWDVVLRRFHGCYDYGLVFLPGAMPNWVGGSNAYFLAPTFVHAWAEFGRLLTQASRPAIRSFTWFEIADVFRLY